MLGRWGPLGLLGLLGPRRRGRSGLLGLLGLLGPSGPRRRGNPLWLPDDRPLTPIPLPVRAEPVLSLSKGKLHRGGVEARSGRLDQFLQDGSLRHRESLSCNALAQLRNHQLGKALEHLLFLLVRKHHLEMVEAQRLQRPQGLRQALRRPGCSQLSGRPQAPPA